MSTYLTEEQTNGRAKPYCGLWGRLHKKICRQLTNDMRR